MEFNAAVSAHDFYELSICFPIQQSLLLCVLKKRFALIFILAYSGENLTEASQTMISFLSLSSVVKAVALKRFSVMFSFTGRKKFTPPTP